MTRISKALENTVTLASNVEVIAKRDPSTRLALKHAGDCFTAGVIFTAGAGVAAGIILEAPGVLKLVGIGTFVASSLYAGSTTTKSNDAFLEERIRTNPRLREPWNG